MNAPKYSLYALLMLLFMLPMGLYAHPLDEFCLQGEMDPLLCAELAALDMPREVKNDALPEIDLDRSPWQTAILYTRLGISHILPAGLDHLLFVLALLLSSRQLKSLLLQISLFTLAHSVTLVLTVLGVIAVSGRWVEVLIALSIAFVGLENIFFKNIQIWRPLVVFCFGLLHGLGFAGALQSLGIPGEHFIFALVGFNVGVEIGQLSFALMVFGLIFWLIKKPWYGARVVLPTSMVIVAVGAWWALERWLG